MKKISKYFIVIVLLIGLSVNSCKKQDDFLNVKQNLNQVVPATLNDYQAILDNNYSFNKFFPGAADAGSDNIIVSDANLDAVDQVPRNMYLWSKDIFQGQNSTDWYVGYQMVEYSNIVLDGLAKMNTPPDQVTLAQYNSIKGSALFFRTFMFYLFAGEYCKVYNSQSASTDLGIVLRLNSDVAEKAVRSTVQQTYDQMINDLKVAIPLLPVTSTTGYQMRPTQPAAYALLAKIYLAMSDYKDALDASTQSLKEFNTLLDYNSSLVSPGNGTGTFPAYPNNPEISFWAATTGDGVNIYIAGGNVSDVTPTLYNSYDDNDLRKTCFYTSDGAGGYTFVGTYATNILPFGGIATDEVLLIQAECFARASSTQLAIDDLNALLVKRYKTGTYVPFTSANFANATELLNKILLERRKELPFTGQLRWEDLRRLNQDPNYATTLTRTYHGQTYTLSPNSPRYVLPIPDNEIQLTGIQQNLR